MAPNTPSKITAVRLSFVTYQHPDLQKACAFLRDFGFHEARREDQRIYYAGFGSEIYSYVAEQSPDAKRHFIGATWTVESEHDIEAASKHPSACAPIDNPGPGGGKLVSIVDPNGFTVSFIYGQETKATASGKDFKAVTRDEEKSSAESPPVPNSAYEKPRKGRYRRFDAGPSPVHKLGHYGYVVPESKYKETFDWYTAIMNLAPTDAVYDPKTHEDKTCFLHLDRGITYTDHHSFFLAAGPPDSRAHVHHSSFEVNDFDTQLLGHDYLQNKGWTNCWGVGRHVLGSQIFDYWFDASGNVVEHYSDGDLVNVDTAFERHPEAPDSLYIWGPNIPKAFVTGKIEDAGMPMPPPPEVPNVVVAS